MRKGASALLLAFAACVAAPSDPFVRAGAAARSGDLLAALAAYESVPATDPRHEEARANALEVEVRMQRSHQSLLDGIVLRGNGEDRSALTSMERARDAWPGLPSIDRWIAATRVRLGQRTAAAARTAGLRPAVDCEGPFVVVEEEEAGERGADAAVSQVSAPRPRIAAPRPVVSVGDEDAISLGLVQVETRLARGELELAVLDLLELARRHPVDFRVQDRLARVLHQRALLRYGQGALAAAIADWERVIAIQPDNRVVHALLDAVRAEAAAPAR
ncbi:MAG: tetratricopeptide repeat protein [Planctomycetes bacterium]|nr:tetratricopeptide repeat protein [Planctomycetota bacterium]